MKFFYEVKSGIQATRIKPYRYQTLIREVLDHKCSSILEVGVFNGRNSLRMIEAAKANFSPADIHYYGFDLFEMLTETELKEEFSKMPLTEQQIFDKLSPTGAHIHLYKGFSQKTLKSFVQERQGINLDFIYIDGGHSIDTIRSDWNNLKPLIKPRTVVIFDDYYENDEDFILGKGCNKLIDELDREKYRVELVDPLNEFEHDWGTLRVRYAKVQLK
jgi:hypothetical protein